MNNTLGSQRGATLIISLIILLLVTILGVSSLQSTTLEEKMAASTRNVDLAFQAAESALRAAEAEIDANINRDNGFSDDCRSTSGLCNQVSAASAFHRWQDPEYCGAGLDIWQCDASVALSGSDALDSDIYSAQPRYFIEVLQEVGTDDGDTLNMGNIGDTPAEDSAMYYRITALGFGGSTYAKVVLQSTYGK